MFTREKVPIRSVFPFAFACTSFGAGLGANYVSWFFVRRARRNGGFGFVVVFFAALGHSLGSAFFTILVEQHCLGWDTARCPRYSASIKAAAGFEGTDATIPAGKTIMVICKQKSRGLFWFPTLGTPAGGSHHRERHIVLEQWPAEHVGRGRVRPSRWGWS